MSWIPFSQEQPKQGQSILMAAFVKDKWLLGYYESFQVGYPYHASYWQAVSPPPKPDPFEEWWDLQERTCDKTNAIFNTNIATIAVPRIIASEIFQAGQQAEKEKK